MNAVTQIRAASEVTQSPLALLRAPFPANQISKLPKPYKKDSPKGNCTVCDGYHGLPALHLDYVGHAALTDRLLDADPLWSWEPVAFTPEGMPAFDRNGGLWIRLTVCGVTRLGYGNAEGKSGGDAVKEIIGDAMRNAGMRFGMALDLWHKGDLHKPEDDSDDEPRKALWIVSAKSAIECLNTEVECAGWYKKNLEMMKSQPAAERDEVLAYLKHRKTSLAPLPTKATDDEARFSRPSANSVARSNGGPDPFGPEDEIPF